MLSRKSLLAATAVIALMAAGGTASAAPFISGSLWEVTNAQASNATQAQAAALGAAQVTFQANGVDFSSYGNLTNTGNGSLDYTIQSWLNSLGQASNIKVTAAGTGAGVALTDSLNKNGGGTFVQLTGSAVFTHGQTYTVAHDDGITFQVNGSTILSVPGPTAPVTTPFTYNGPTGTETFNFVYGECCGPPAVLETTLVPAAVPEPGSLALLGTALAGLGLALSLHRRKAA